MSCPMKLTVEDHYPTPVKIRSSMMNFVIVFHVWGDSDIRVSFWIRC